MRRGSFLLLLLATAAAHEGHSFEPIYATQGEAAGFLTVNAAVLRADRAVTLSLELVDRTTYDPLGPPQGVRAEAASTNMTLEGVHDGDVWFANATFPSEGPWRILARVDADTTIVFPLTVWPPSDWRIDAGPAQIYEGSNTISFFLVDERTDARSDRQVEAFALVPSGAEDTSRVPLARGTRPGELILTHTFTQAGPIEVRFAIPALAVRPDDQPPIVLDVQAGGPPGRATPGLGLLVVVSLIGALAVVWRRKD